MRCVMAADLSPENASPGRWLSIVGIGEDGAAGLGEAAQDGPARGRTRLRRRPASGAGRTLDPRRGASLAEPLRPTAWTPCSPPRGTKVCVLASGDPFCHGVGATLAPGSSRRRWPSIRRPRPSAWPRRGSAGRCRSHGRVAAWPEPRPRPPAPASRRALLGADLGRQTARPPWRAACGSRLRRLGLTVLEALGGPRERIRQAPPTASR